jgi:hypothetical protein
MSDEYQIDIPPSFIALYTDKRQRLTVPLRTLRERYEICEDLANHMVEHARSMHHEHGLSEDELLARCGAGLLSADAGMSAQEGTWIVRRLAELLGWQHPVHDSAG